MQGIPSNLSLAYVQEWVTPRVSGKRLKHIEGVAEVAKKIARAYDCDPYMAQLAAWLHDSCKEHKPRDLVNEARAFNIKFGPLEEAQGHLLHGPVAAEVARTELGVTNEEVLAAIAEHTLGNVPMCRLSEVLFLADCLEEGRSHDYTAPIWASLSLNDEINVDRAMVTAMDLGLMHLMETARPIHPRTVDVRNYYLEKMQAKQAQV